MKLHHIPFFISGSLFWFVSLFYAIASAHTFGNNFLPLTVLEAVFALIVVIISLTGATLITIGYSIMFGEKK